MFLIAELPEFTEIRLIYQTKQKIIDSFQG